MYDGSLSRGIYYVASPSCPWVDFVTCEGHDGPVAELAEKEVWSCELRWVTLDSWEGIFGDDVCGVGENSWIKYLWILLS